MKKLLTLLLSNFIIIGGLLAQIPYYDAIKLNDFVTNGKFDLDHSSEITTILEKYTSTVVVWNENPFIKEYIADENVFLDSISDSSLGVASSSEKSIAGSISGLNVTNLADGLAKFLVERTKQELSITFFDKFKKELDSIAELKLLFPNTKIVLDAIGEEIYMYSNYLNSLKEAFKKDLEIILSSLDNYISKEHSDKPNIVEPFSAGLFFTNQIKNGVHPAEAANKLSTRKGKISDYKDENFRKFMYTLKVLDIFSQSLRSDKGKDYWISSSELNLLFDETTLKIYFGLLYQLHKDTQIGENSHDTFGLLLTNIQSLEENFKQPLVSFINKTDELQLTINSIKVKKSKGEKIDSYFSIFSNAVAMLGEGETLTTALGYKTKTEQIEMYLYIANLTGNIYVDINEKRYNTLILDIVSLSDTLNLANKETNKKILKYGSFIANVAQAENSDQVQAAIQAIALPIGSATIKKRTETNISLNAYVGLSPGLEYSSELAGWNPVFGINTPIGIAYSKGKFDADNDKVVEKGSNTWFISVIDIGAISTFRFGDSETEAIPEISLTNIFAPGLYWIKGFKNIPLSFGIGGQMGPQIRKLTATGSEVSSGLNTSFKIFLAVDIPLLNFYTKSR